MIYGLANDFHDVLLLLPSKHRYHSLLRLIQEGLNGSVFGVNRHPTTLFQSLWNVCWWFDCPESEHHYEEPKDGWPKGMPPWSQDGPKLHRLLEAWRAAIQGVAPSRRWLRSLRPPAISLGSGQQAEIRRPGGTYGPILVLHQDAKFLSEHDGILSIWDVASRSEIETIRIADGPLARWVMSGCGTRIAGHSRAGELLVWDIREQRRLFVREGVKVNNFLYLKFSDDGRFLAVNAEGTVTVYDVDSLCELSSFCALSIGPHNPFRSDVFFLDDQTLGIGIEDYRDKCNKVVLFDIFSLQTTGTIRLPLYSRPQSLKFEFHRATARLLVIGGTRAYIVDTHSGTMRFMLGVPHGRPGIFQNNHKGQYIRGGFSSEGRLISTCGDDSDRTIRLWDAFSGEFVGCNSESHRGAVYSVDFLSDEDGNRYLISSGQDGAVRIWDRYASDTPLRLPDLDVRRIDSIACSESGTLFACGGDNDSIYVYDGAHGVKRYHFFGGDEYEGLAFSSDEKFLFTGDDKPPFGNPASGLSQCNLSEDETPVKYIGAATSVDRAIISRDNRLLVGTGAGSLAAWLLGKPSPEFIVEDYGYRYPTQCALSPDGTKVAFAYGSQVELWNPQGQRLARWTCPIELSDIPRPSIDVDEGTVTLAIGRWEYRCALNSPHQPVQRRRSTAQPTIDSCVVPDDQIQKVTRSEKRYSWDVNYRLSWDLRGVDPSITYTGVAIDTNQIRCSHDGRLVFAKGWDKHAIWEIGRSEPLYCGSGFSFSECTLSSDREWIVLANSRRLEVRSRAGQLIAEWSIPAESETPHNLRFTEDSQYVAFVVDGWQVLWSITELDRLPELQQCQQLTSGSSEARRNDWRVHVTEEETTLVDAETGIEVAWYPASLDKVAASAERGVLAGAYLNHFVLLKLVSNAKSVAQPPVGYVPKGGSSRPRKQNPPSARHLNACKTPAILRYLSEVLQLAGDRFGSTAELTQQIKSTVAMFRAGAEGNLTRSDVSKCRKELNEAIAKVKSRVNDTLWQAPNANADEVSLLTDLKVLRCVMALVTELMRGASHRKLAEFASENTKQLLSIASADSIPEFTASVWNIWRWVREIQMQTAVEC